MLASERLAQQARAPLPATTPHTLRRTYISIALVANGFDVKWVMSQVGHANSKMTMDVYAQLEQRVDRRHGTAFDELLRNAQGQHQDTNWATGGLRGRKPPCDRSGRGKEKARTPGDVCGGGKTPSSQPDSTRPEFLEGDLSADWPHGESVARGAQASSLSVRELLSLWASSLRDRSRGTAFDALIRRARGDGPED
jgi:hypothetical protein